MSQMCKLHIQLGDPSAPCVFCLSRKCTGRSGGLRQASVGSVRIIWSRSISRVM